MSTQTILDQDPTFEPIVRRKLLPWWIKTFSWIFMVIAAFIPFVFGAAVIFHVNSQIAFYGIQTTEPLSIIGLILSAIYLLKGVVGYGLWFEKDWAITVGIVDVAIGITACLCVMFVFPKTEAFGFQNSSFRLEILFLAAFLAKLLQIKKRW